MFILPELTGKVLRLDFKEERVCVTKRLLDVVVVKFKHVQFRQLKDSSTNKDELDEPDLLSHIESDKGVLEKGG